jgi:pimeloyl-ACP methyl ester carboxylesterase
VSIAELNGAQIAYEVIGSGPAVTLVHAGIADRRMWRDTVPALAHEFTVLTYDQRGFGESTLPSGPAAYTDDLRALLDHVGLEQTAVVGASMGGRAALELALIAPDRVTKLILVGSPLTKWDWSDEMQCYDEQETEALEAGDFDRAVELNLDFWVGPADPAVRDLVAEMQRRAFEIPVPEPEPTGPPALDPPPSERIGDVAAPTLVVVGEQDIEDMRRIADVLGDGIPGSRKVTMPGVAHLPALERPQEFNRILLDFLHT